MILTCPSCDTKYNLPGATIKEGGRKVKCAKCGFTWVQRPEPEPDAATPAAAAPAPVVAPVVAEPAAAAESAAVEDKLAPDPEAAIDPVDSARRARRMREASAAPKEPPPEKPERRNAWWQWAAVAAVLLAVAAGLVLGRDAVVAAWPEAINAYNAIGLAPMEPGDGLKLSAVQGTNVVEEGKLLLKVEADLVNTTDAAVPIPQLTATLKDGDKVLQTWTFTPAGGEVAAKATLHFENRLPDPKEGSTNVLLSVSPQQ